MFLLLLLHKSSNKRLHKCKISVIHNCGGKKNFERKRQMVDVGQTSKSIMKKLKTQNQCFTMTVSVSEFKSYRKPVDGIEKESTCAQP